MGKVREGKGKGWEMAVGTCGGGGQRERGMGIIYNESFGLPVGR